MEALYVSVQIFNLLSTLRAHGTARPIGQSGQHTAVILQPTQPRPLFPSIGGGLEEK